MQYHGFTREKIHSVASEVALRQTSRAPIPGLGSSRQFVRSANEECKKVTLGTWDWFDETLSVIPPHSDGRKNSMLTFVIMTTTLLISRELLQITWHFPWYPFKTASCRIKILFFVWAISVSDIWGQMQWDSHKVKNFIFDATCNVEYNVMRWAEYLDVLD